MTLWTVACQAPLFMGFSMLEYWSGLPFPPPGDILHPEIESACTECGFFIYFETGNPGSAY